MRSIAVKTMIVLAVAAVAAAAPGKSIRTERKPIPGTYIVRLADDSAVGARVRQLTQELARDYKGKVIHTYDSVLGGFAARMSRADAERMAQDSRVEEVAEDGMPPAPAAVQGPPVSNALDRIDQTLLPLNATYSYDYSGNGITIYVIDTGITPHPEFGNRLIGARNFWTNHGQVNNPNDVNECYPHGSGVAGVAAGATDGVAKNANIYSVKAFGCTTTESSASDYIAAINWVASVKRGNPSTRMVATMSLIAFPNPDLNLAAVDLVAAGVPFTVAAGNNNHGDACDWSPGVVGNPNNVPVNPAGLSIITVGASNPVDDTGAPFTNVGSCVDLFAPGMNMTTLNGQPTEGTSLATPLVAGVAALRLEMTPSLTATEVENAIKGYASSNRLTDIGAGSPNLLLYSHTRKRRACCS